MTDAISEILLKKRTSVATAAEALHNEVSGKLSELRQLHGAALSAANGNIVQEANLDIQYGLPIDRLETIQEKLDSMLKNYRNIKSMHQAQVNPDLPDIYHEQIKALRKKAFPGQDQPRQKPDSAVLQR
jgi:hypothetical protein